MARCTDLLVVKSVSINPFNNALTLVDLAEALNIEASEEPTASADSPLLVAPFDWVVVALLQRDSLGVPEDVTGRVTIVSPHGREFPGANTRVDLVTHGNARNLSLMPAFPYTGNGVYRFLFQVLHNDEWNTAAEFSLPITISVRRQETAQS